MTKPKNTDIPRQVYENLRAVATSRFYRKHGEMPTVTLSNSDIFLMMPDHNDIHWGKEGQEQITSITLDRMLVELEASR